MARVALVTGAARGIGAATVTALAADGWRVVAVDRCADDPDVPYSLGTQAELDRLASDHVVTAVADTRDADALAAVVAGAEARWGGLDAAVAAAAVIAGGVPAWEVPAGQERAVLDIDLGGVLTLARVAVPAMLRRPQPRRGRFLAVASAAATRGLPMLAATARPRRAWPVRPRARGRAAWHGRHRERRQPGFDRYGDAGRERSPLRAARR